MTTTQSAPDTTPQLALNGGPKSFPGRTGRAEPKIGIAEFFSIAKRFGFSDSAMERLRRTVTDNDLGNGPHLGRYWGSANPSMGEQFENLVRQQFKVKHAYAVSNGTCALQAALVAVGAGPGSEVICPATGFLATSMAAALVGATPVFCDVDSSLQMDPSKIAALITPRTVALMPTHHWGVVADMDPIMAIARQHKLKVVEDCAQSPGATYHGQPVGSIGDVGCFSISCYKIIGGGEGGMVITQDDRLFDRLRQMAEGGGLWREDRFGKPRYEGELFAGSNFRLTELESSVNVIQMQKLEGIVSRYRKIWQQIKPQIPAVKEIQWQKSNDPAGDIGYMARCFPKDDTLGRQLAAALGAEGVNARYRGHNDGPDWHLCRDFFPLFEKFAANCDAGKCPVATDLYNRCLTLDLDQWWNEADCDAVIRGINKVFTAYCTPA